MSFHVWCEIVCYGCNSTVAGRYTTNSPPRNEMKKVAYIYGWRTGQSILTNQRRWFCGKCLTNPSIVKMEPVK